MMMVKTVREHFGADGSKSKGQEYEVSGPRAQELQARGLVEIMDAKMSRPARNKMAPPPQNKGG